MARNFFNVITTAALVALSLVLTACSKSGAPQEQGAMDMTALVTAEKVEEDFPETVKKYVGVFEAINSVEVVARVSGKINEVNVEEGRSVEADTQLFRIEDDTYKANVAAAEANVATCEANITSSEANLNSSDAQVKQLEAKLTYAVSSFVRYARLYCGKESNLEKIAQPLRDPKITNEGIYQVIDQVKALVAQITTPAAAVSKDDYENAETNLRSAIAALESARAARQASLGALNSAKASLDAAKAKLDLAIIDNNYTVVTSDISGRAGRLNFSLGNYVTPNSGALITVTQMDPIYVRFSMSEQDYSDMFGSITELQNCASVEVELLNGQRYPIKVNADGQNLLFLDNSVHTNMDSVYVWGTFENKEQIFNPGGICRVIVKRRLPEKCAFVRNTAIQHDATGIYLYVVGKDNLVERRSVELGPASLTHQSVLPNEDPQKTLRAGEVVVTGGAHKIIMMPGMPTKVKLGQPTGLTPEETPQNVTGVVGKDAAPNAVKKPAAFDAEGREVAKVQPKEAKPSENASEEGKD